jgi:hypothetical protein
MSLKFFLFIFSFLITNSFQTSEIRIISPKNLDLQLKSLPIDMEFSSFGKNPSNFHVRGQIYLANDENSTACESLNMSLIKDEENEEKTDKFPILLIRRGGCSFTTKVRNAQNVGASMVFIADNKHENIHSIIMADDGTGNDIVIPSAMINYEDGNIIINYMKENKNELIIVDANFGVIETENENDKNVTFEFFFSSSEIRAYEFLKNISEYLSDFGSQILFIPHYVTHRSPFYDSNSQKPIENCVSFGKYCYFPKETTVEKDGRNIVIEDVRQKCMYNLSVMKNKISNYFKYMNSFYENCLNVEDNKRINEECSQIALVNAGFTQDYLNNCVKESFYSNKYNLKEMIENDNSLLSNDYRIQNDYIITTFPAVSINKKSINGAIKESVVISKICEEVEKKPNFCLNNEFVSKKGMSFSSIFFIICFFVVINVVIFILCRNYIQKRVYERVNNSEIDIDGRINNVIANYFSLKDSK